MDKNMNKKITITLLILILLLTTSIVFISKNKSVNATLDTVSLKDVEKNNMFAIMVKGEDGEYKEQSIFPGNDYKLNTEKSGCMDNNGEKIENSLTYESDKITVSTNKTSYCYLYFDKKTPENPQELIDSRTNDESLSDEPIGGMYRYQGVDELKGNKVKNYICLNEVGLNGCNATSSGTDENMYRIIGITEEGNIKVIKQTRYESTHQWWDNYSTNKEWPESTIFSTLNNTYYNTLDSSIQNKIEPQQWLYGDISYGYINSNIPTETVYKIETGQANTKYIDPITGKEVTDKKWEKKTESKPIGLMYIHDYAYALSGTGSESSCRQDAAQCKTSWIHMSNNGGETSTDERFEWTMTRMGRNNAAGTAAFSAWWVGPSGAVDYSNLSLGYAIRPVFYLKSDVVLEGTGEIGTPFYIVS